MNILTPENTTMNTILIGNDISDRNIYYGVLDYSNIDDVDYKFEPLVCLEDYPKACWHLKIGPYQTQVPFHWSILIGDMDDSELQLMPIKEFLGRDFQAFIFNPCSSYRPEYWLIEILNIHQEVKWNVPFMNPERMLIVPLAIGENPPCAYFAESKNKIPDGIQLRDLF